METKKVLASDGVTMIPEGAQSKLILDAVRTVHMPMEKRYKEIPKQIKTEASLYRKLANVGPDFVTPLLNKKGEPRPSAFIATGWQIKGVIHDPTEFLKKLADQRRQDQLDDIEEMRELEAEKRAERAEKKEEREEKKAARKKQTKN